MKTEKRRVWVNFAELRKMLGFDVVLAHYKVEVKRKGDQHQGPCPLPCHGDGPNVAPFSAHLVQGIFQCFGCGAKGNIIEFAALMERADPEDGSALRQVALRLRAALLPDDQAAPPAPKAEAPKPVAATATPSTARVLVNAPLDFELKGLEPAHPAVLGKGIDAGTAAHFGVGFCSRGFLRGRIAIPIHDGDGRLVGYSGLLADERDEGADFPRYLFPDRRERNGSAYEFDLALLLYGAHRVGRACDDLIVVRDFPAVWHLARHGFPRAVALMGGECSEAQAEQVARLTKPSGRVWVLPDGDAEGESLARSVVLRVSPHRLVRWARPERGSLAASLPPAQLGLLLSFKP